MVLVLQVEGDGEGEGRKGRPKKEEEQEELLSLLALPGRVDGVIMDALDLASRPCKERISGLTRNLPLGQSWIHLIKKAFEARETEIPATLRRPNLLTSSYSDATRPSSHVQFAHAHARARGHSSPPLSSLLNHHSLLKAARESSALNFPWRR